MSLQTSVWPALERRHASGVYALREVTWVRGEGARVWDADGRAYLDFTSGHGVAILGHAHPALARALARQARTLITCPASFPNDVRARYLSRLAAVLPDGLDRIFLCNSGTEAVEAALKFARLSTGRPRILALRRAFHGRTLGALSATWTPRYRTPFEPLVPGVEHLPPGDLAAARAAIDETTAAVIVEAVQGEGGVHVLPFDYLRGLADLCRARGALWIVDEVQTGFGRTGRLWAVEHVGRTPDLLCLGKGIAGGVPMGAVALGPRVRNLAPGLHGSTFGGNPLACAAALATLRVLQEEGLVERAARLGTYLQARLQELGSTWIRQVRGLGLMAGVEVRGRAAPVLRALERRGVLALPAGRQTVRFLPPLIVTEAEIDEAVEALAEALEETRGGTAR